MEFYTTGPVEGAACMCERVWGKYFKSSNLLKDFIFRQKKRTKKVFLSITENINNVFKFKKKKKRGRSIYFGTRSAKEESADDILFNLC